MTNPRTEPRTRPRVQLREFETTVLASLYEHRLLTTTQIQRLHDPGSHRRWTQKRLRELEQAGYITRASGPPPGREARWFLTGMGATLAEAAGDVRTRDFRMDAHRAVTGVARHLLAVNDIGVALTAAARRFGDEFDHRSWRHEVAHDCGPAATDVLIADAVLTYDVWDAQDVSSQWRFLELDRGTQSVHTLVEKLRAYAALHDYAPSRRKDTSHLPRTGWRRLYAAFPGVLFVLADQAPDEVDRRLTSLAGFVATDPVLTRADKLRITATSLRELTDQGPFAPVFRRIPSLERVPLHRRRQRP